MKVIDILIIRPVIASRPARGLLKRALLSHGTSAYRPSSSPCECHDSHCFLANCFSECDPSCLEAVCTALRLVKLYIDVQVHRRDVGRLPQLDDQVPSKTMQPYLRRCHKCGGDERPMQKLKRCAGCEFAVYCSRECQKAAWPDHKKVCRRELVSDVPRALQKLLLDAEVRPYGYQSSSAFITGLKEWAAQANPWALHACVDICVLLIGGIDFDKLEPDYTLHLKMKCNTRAGQPASGRNPASAFRYLLERSYEADYSQESRTSSTNNKSWPAEDRKRAGDSYRASHGDTFRSLLPVYLNCDNVSTGVTLNYPLFHHVGAKHPLDQASRDVLTDMLLLAQRSSSFGFPLRFPQVGADRLIPLPGHFMRRQGNWIWEPYFMKWEDYSPTSTEYPGLHETIASFKTGLSPKEILKRFQYIRYGEMD
ncbi:hypothetical protein FKP32DRAFT_1760766 [Trametes sanguinea]|nr:hypothetical protein FKP32DRAFT_1760766 [Trametes sanguinea]